MSDLKMVSPLLDHMTVEGEGQNGRYTLRSLLTGEPFILERLSVPASDRQVRALILSGAYPDEAAVHAYYGGVVNDMKKELDTGKELAKSGCFAGCVSYQIEKQDSGVGYDVYILRSPYVRLNDLMQQAAMTNLRAVNLGIDLCDAISACREAGYLFGNLRPESVCFTPSGKFRLGGLGLVSLEDLKYSSLPEDYIGAFSAPELSDIAAPLNLTVDLYSLGMVLYRVYNGGHGPFEDEHTGESMADRLRMTGKPLPTPIYADYEMAGIILKACSFRKEERFQSPEEFKQALVLYMQRNEVSDTLIVPPIVAAPEPIAELPDEPQEEAPMRMTDAEQLDENFRRSFAPDLSGAGTEQDIDPELAAAPEPPEEPKAESPEPAEQPEPPKQPEPEAETEPLSEDDDPDQMDIDELLASVNKFVGTAPADMPADASATAAQEPDHDYIDEAPEEPENAEAGQDGDPKKKKKKKMNKAPVIVLILLILLAAAAYFLLKWYYVDVNALELISCTPERMTVELVSDDSLDRFQLSCTDSYGNAYPVTADGNAYTFTGLSGKTTYTLTVTASEHHKLSAASPATLTVVTPETTQITEMTAVRGEADGEVLVSFTQEGPAPARWKLSCTDEASGDSRSFEFAGNAYLVSGLEQNRVYTFQMENSESVYLTGQTSVQYELLPIVEAKNLNISEITGNTVTVVWTPGENTPEQWSIACEAEGMEPISGTSSEPSYTLTLPDFSHDYTIFVSAQGMDTPASLLLPSNPIIVENLRALIGEGGTADLSWDTPAGSPAGGWYVSYNTVGSVHAAYMPNAEDGAVTGNSVRLEGLIPNAEYEFTLSLTTQDSSASVFGTLTVRAETPEAAAFDGYSISPTPPLGASSGYVSLWTLPEQADWDYTNLRNHKTTFATDERIAVCLEVNSISASEDTVTLLYALRDSEGRIVNDVSQQLEWDSVWYSRRHAGEIPLPAASGEESAPGDYVLEIYVNGRLLSSVGFTIA